jgi:hypothetical protein
MFRKSTLLAFAAAAALGLAMLSPTIASAKHGGGHGGGHGGHHGGGKHGGGHHGKHGGHGMHGHHGHGHHHHGHRHRHRHPHWHVRYHRPVWYAPRPVYVASRPVAGPCTCLSKEYTSDGRVLFKDLCTNEAAMNPPIVTPQQSGAIDAPVQQAANAVAPLYQTAPPNAQQQVDPQTGLPK